MIGDWLNDDTPVKEIAMFAEKTFAQNDLSGFKGDPQFAQNSYSHKMFSKLRSSIAGLYEWRFKHATEAADKERMARATDLALRQALALCPYSPEAVFHYVTFLNTQNRNADAMWVATTALKQPLLPEENRKSLYDFVEFLKKAAK
jgi:hypothetical protein